MFAASAARAPRVLLLKRWMTTADAAAAAGAAGTAKKTHYDVLGLKHAATAKEVKSQYYKLSLKHHPDRNVGDADATKTFSVIRDAYDTLSDEAKRRQYDHSIGMGVHPNLHHHHHHPHQQHHWSPKPSTMASSSQHIRYDQHAHYQAHYAGGSDARERKRREQENHEFHKNNKGTHFWHIVVIIAGAVFLAQVVSNQMKEQTAQQLKQK